MKKDTIIFRLGRFAQKPAAMWVALAIGLVGFVAICLRTIGDASIWFDEAFSAYITRFNFGEIMQYTAADVHPPLYYLVLKVWEMFFGTSDLAIRSLSVLFGCVAIVFAFLLVKKLFGKKTAVISLLLLALLPILIRYSQEARMYTMTAAIAFSATYMLVRAGETKKRSDWAIYAILVAAGMLTHYFMALVWIAHWVWHIDKLWRGGTRGKKFFQQLFSGQWWRTYILAVILFLPWLPFMIKQLTVIQVAGFWIGPISLDTFSNVITNFFLYQEHGEVKSWLVVCLLAILIGLVWTGVRAYKSMDADKKASYRLILYIGVVPIMLLVISSLPPLQPSFVERYLLPSFMALAISAAIAISVCPQKAKLRIGLVLLITILMILGIRNVEYYGNYNKNSGTAVDTKTLVQEVQSAAADGEPIIASTPWIYYEAVFYDTPENPVYFIDAQTEYNFGSLEMLKNSDFHKILDLEQFSDQHDTVWYIGRPDGAEMESPDNSWQEVQVIDLDDRMTGQPSYRAVQYKTNN